MLTMRPFNEDRTWGDKQRKVYILDQQGNKIYDPVKRQYKCSKVQTTDWNEKCKAEEWRKTWAKTANKYLEKLKHFKHIDHRSYDRQGKDQLPTIHLGVAAHQMEQRGIRTERGDINREIEISNNLLRKLKARIVELQKWLKQEMVNTEPPTLADVISNILERTATEVRYEVSQSAYNINDSAKILNFLTRNKIKDLPDLDKKFGSMFAKQSEIAHQLNPIDSRIRALNEHIKQTNYYMEFREISKLYKQQKPKHREGFYETHRREITLYNTAKSHLDSIMNGKKQLPIEAWKKEKERLNAERQCLSQEYRHLKYETAEIEQIRNRVYDIILQEKHRVQPHHSHDIEL